MGERVYGWARVRVRVGACNILCVGGLQSGDSKMNFFEKKLQNCLAMSEKSSNFAVRFNGKTALVRVQVHDSQRLIVC